MPEISKLTLNGIHFRISDRYVWYLMDAGNPLYSTCIYVPIHVFVGLVIAEKIVCAHC